MTGILGRAVVFIIIVLQGYVHFSAHNTPAALGWWAMGVVWIAAIILED